MNHILKEYDSSFRKFLSRSIGRIHLASMIYGVSGNRRFCFGYEGDTSHKFEPVDDLKITYKPLYDQFKYVHAHDIRLTSHAQKFSTVHTKKLVTHPKKYHADKPKEYHVEKQKVTCLMSVSEEQWVWHRRLGHASLRKISQINKLNLVRGLPNLKY